METRVGHARAVLELPTEHLAEGSMRAVPYPLDGDLRVDCADDLPNGVQFTVLVRLGGGPVEARFRANWPVHPTAQALAQARPYLLVYARAVVAYLERHLAAVTLIATAAGQPHHQWHCGPDREMVAQQIYHAAVLTWIQAANAPASQ